MTFQSTSNDSKKLEQLAKFLSLQQRQLYAQWQELDQVLAHENRALQVFHEEIQASRDRQQEIESCLHQAMAKLQDPQVASDQKGSCVQEIEELLEETASEQELLDETAQQRALHQRDMEQLKAFQQEIQQRILVNGQQQQVVIAAAIRLNVFKASGPSCTKRAC